MLFQELEGFRAVSRSSWRFALRGGDKAPRCGPFSFSAHFTRTKISTSSRITGGPTYYSGSIQAVSNGTISAMKSGISTSIDSAGRIVLPKAVREKAHLTPGTRLSVTFVDGHIEIEPEAMDIQVVQRGKLFVAEPVSETEPLTAAVVQQVINSVRDERGIRR